MSIEDAIMVPFRAFALFTFGSGSAELDSIGIGFLCGPDAIRPLSEALEINQLAQD